MWLMLSFCRIVVRGSNAADDVDVEKITMLMTMIMDVDRVLFPSARKVRTF